MSAKKGALAAATTATGNKSPKNPLRFAPPLSSSVAPGSLLLAAFRTIETLLEQMDRGGRTTCDNMKQVESLQQHSNPNKERQDMQCPFRCV
mmetsp:Transcript_20000/g.39718  ORF Transcript_20000/g.39718 Transcript_20000/m.39718 type:complete len:92 (-) Transcript_20000:214-489(-)